MARRRTRYLAELSREGVNSERQILAYSELSARNYFTGRGYQVHSLTPHRPSKSWTRPANKPWRKDERAIREAIEFLGLTLPVRIKLTGHAAGRHGAHHLYPEGGTVRHSGTRIWNIDTATGLFHHITVKSWLSAAEASRVIWHELAHAMQAEHALAELPADAHPREAIEAWVACESHGRGVTYEDKPVEIEAREYEEFATEQPLAKELSR